jgi:hypothetical protein
MNYIELLAEYRTLWNNRMLIADTEEQAKEALEEVIQKDIYDQMTHPRTRKTPPIKFYWAIKRIEDSNMKDFHKMGLIHLYIAAMENGNN